MKIAIDISQIVHKGTGVARFTNGLVKAILKYDKQNQWSFFFSSLRQKLDENLEQEIIKQGHKLIKWKIPPTILSLLWNHSHELLKRFMFHVPCFNNFNWFITSDWIEPPLKNIKKATIVHDLVYLRYPQTVDGKIQRVQQKRLFWVKKESQIIFADSKTTKNDLTNLLNINSKKIIVNYPGVEAVKPSENMIKKTLAKYKIQKPFILTVGKIEPRKNLKRLIAAFQEVNHPSVDLIIAGISGWENLKFQSLNQSNGIKLLGFINDNELYSLYSRCLFYIQPSIWEGFGYPVIEAMKLGAPVACSNTSSMAEIAGNAALLFDPFDINAIKKSLTLMIQDSHLKKELAVKGQQRSQIFTWKNYFQTLISSLLANSDW